MSDPVPIVSDAGKARWICRFAYFSDVRHNTGDGRSSTDQSNEPATDVPKTHVGELLVVSGAEINLWRLVPVQHLAAGIEVHSLEGSHQEVRMVYGC